MTPFQQRQLTLMRQMEHQLAAGTPVGTIIPMQSDFANDPQLAITCITPVPIRIATKIQTEIIEPLRSIEPKFFYYPNESLHVTIQNIRVIHNPPRYTPSDIAKVQEVLKNAVGNAGPFTFEYTRLMRMPTSVSLIALVTPEYDQFVRKLRKSLIDAGVPDDKTYFTDEVVFANTTICRYTQAPSEKFIETIQKLKDIQVGMFTAKNVSFMEMNAVAGPSKKRVIQTYNFHKN